MTLSSNFVSLSVEIVSVEFRYVPIITETTTHDRLNEKMMKSTSNRAAGRSSLPPSNTLPSTSSASAIQQDWDDREFVEVKTHSNAFHFCSP